MANETAISLPFSIDYSGKITATESQSKIWADRVRSVIGTAVRQRVMRPTFGTLIPYALFENQDNAVVEIKVEIEKAFAAQLPLLSLTGVTVNLGEFLQGGSTDTSLTYQGSSDQTTISAELTYTLPNNTPVTTILGVISIAGTLPAYEEIQ